MAEYLLFYIFGFLLSFTFGVVLFHFVTKLFKLEKADIKLAFKVTLIISLILGAVEFALMYIFPEASTSSTFWRDLTILFVGFFVFHKIAQYYYGTRLLTNIGLYIVEGMIISGVLFLLLFFSIHIFTVLR